jgi:hypothetical protein
VTTEQAKRELGDVFTRLVAAQRTEALDDGVRLGWALCLAELTSELRSSGCSMFTADGVMELIQAVSDKRPTKENKDNASQKDSTEPGKPSPSKA